MNVAELIAELAKLPPDTVVWLQSDAEGNGYEKLRCVDGDAIANPHEQGSILSASWSAGDACMDDDEWERLLAGPRVLVLSP